jgi:hypothetical protein
VGGGGGGSWSWDGCGGGTGRDAGQLEKMGSSGARVWRDWLRAWDHSASGAAEAVTASPGGSPFMHSGPSYLT